MRVVAGVAVTTAVLNGPFLTANAAGWAGLLVAQSARQHDVSTNSLWYFLVRQTPISAINRMSSAAVLASSGCGGGADQVSFRGRRSAAPW